MRTLQSLTLFLFIQHFLTAQQLSYTAINTNKGLPSSEVYSIIEDRQGYMWFATNHGVARYNGKEFITYTTAEGLRDNTVLRMCEDRKGRIWFASIGNELCYWDKGVICSTPASETFRKYMNPTSVTNTLYIDSSDNIWISVTGQSILLKAENNYSECIRLWLCKDNVPFQITTVEGKKPLLTYVGNASFPAPLQQLAISDHTGILNKTKPDYEFFSIKHNEIKFPITKIANALSAKGVHYVAIDNLLWIIEKGKNVGVKKFPNPIIQLRIDNKNGLWIGFRGAGVACYKNCDLDSRPLTLDEKYSVDDICVDHEGGVWIATLQRGVLYAPSTSILVYSNLPYLKDHITFIGMANNSVFFNTYGNSICKEKEEGQVILDDFLCELGKKKASLFYTTTINDTTYLSYSYELMRLAPNLLPLKRESCRGAFSGGKMVFATADSSVWLVYGSGLRKINNQTDSSIDYNFAIRTTCAIAYGNHILVGTKKGLYLFKDKKFSGLSTLDPLLNSQIVDLKQDPDGSVWIATVGNGVLRFKDNKVMSFNVKDGLLSSICTAISIDQYKNIWVGTNKGVSCILYAGRAMSKNKCTIKNITEKNGLISNEITRLLANKNTLWVGTMSGLSAVNITETIQPLPSSQVFITSVKVNDTTILDKTLFLYHENNFRFTLNGLTYKDNGEHTYRYRLIGLNSMWQETQSNELLFNNLAPGDYAFEVQVGNTDKVWSKNTATYYFTIRKPFWLTAWFILLEIVLVIVTVYLLVLWRTTIIRKKEQEKLRINKLLAEYQMKALTAQMNPHFIFNAINSIQNFIIQNHSTLAYDYLIKFSKLIRLVLNNSQDNEVTLQQELETLALYIELEQLRFERSFEYHLKIDPRVDPESLMIPGLLLQPYIENAIWHGLMPLKTRKGIISLSIMQEQELLKITITDNGVGRKASDLIKKKIVHKGHQSVGMELTGKRIELFGQDSKFSLQIIDNYDEQENATGTTVEIVLPMIEMY